MKRISLFLILLFCLSCSHQPEKMAITISFMDSNRSIKISGFDRAVIGDIGRDSSDLAWQSLIPVYKVPVDTDMKDFQQIQLGKYKVADSIVVFTPDTPFVKGQSYFMRFYQIGKGREAMDYITRKSRPGSVSYNNLLFKY